MRGNTKKGAIKTEVSLSVPYLCALIVFLILEPSKAAGQMLLAAFIHETGHIIMMHITGKQPERIVFGAFGVRIESKASPAVSYQTEMLVFFAGPLINFVAALLFFQNKTVRQIHLMMGLFNLLPMGVLDGGQILRCLLQQKMPLLQADKWTGILSLVVGIILFVCSGGVLLFSGYNGTLFLTTLYLFWMLIAESGQI